MGRLYYEKENITRNLLQPITKLESGEVVNLDEYFKNANPNPLQPVAKSGTGEIIDINEYLNKVARLVPSEIIAAYLTMIGFVASIKNEEAQKIIIWIIFIIGLVLTPIYLNSVADSNKPKRNHLILSTIAFIVWAFVTTGNQLLQTISPDIFDQAIASIVLVLFSLISSIIPLNK